MDPIAIILTIAACIGGLLILGFLVWLIAALIVMRRAKKAFAEFDRAFDDAPFSRRDYPKMPRR